MSHFRIATILASLSCTWLFTFGQPVRADELQDISTLHKQGQNDKALDQLESYLTSLKDYPGPKIAQGRFLKGLILAQQGKNAEAIQIFTRLTEEYPELPEPYNNLAVLYASEGQYDKARHALEKAISIHSRYATAHENLRYIDAKMASKNDGKWLPPDKVNADAQTKLELVKELSSASEKKNLAPARSEAPKIALSPVSASVLARVTAAPNTEGSAVVLAPPALSPAIAPVKPESPKPAPAPVVTPVPAPAEPEAAEPAPETMLAPAPADIEADTEAAVLKVLNGWANAWSSKNVGTYLSYYAKDFKAPGGSRASWEKERRNRISRPKSIHLSIEAPLVTIRDASHVSVTFRQSYKSDALQLTTRKTIAMVKAGDKWLIEHESVGR